MFWFFKKKKRDNHIEQRFVNLHKSLNGSFSNIKDDLSDVSKWLGHFKDKHNDHNKQFEIVNYRLTNIEEVLEELKDVWTRVQTAVQTGAVSKQTQTDSCPNSRPKLSKQQKNWTTLDVIKNLTMMERAVVWSLLNTDLKLSYEDLSVALGKDQSTLRGQINSLKTKCEGLIQEYVEKDGKKRFYVSEAKKNEVLTGIKKKRKVAPKAKKAKSES